MKKKIRLRNKDFDSDFDEGKLVVDFDGAIKTEGLSNVVKLPPMDIPLWIAIEIEAQAKLQANSKASVVRQFLVEAIRAREKELMS